METTRKPIVARIPLKKKHSRHGLHSADKSNFGFFAPLTLIAQIRQTAEAKRKNASEMLVGDLEKQYGHVRLSPSWVNWVERRRMANARKEGNR